MTETIFYTDSTPPLATIGALSTGINGCKGDLCDAETLATVDSSLDRVQYALYEDSATWTAWTAWAQDNVFNPEQLDKYSATALQIVGKWDTIEEGDKSFMCITDN